LQSTLREDTFTGSSIVKGSRDCTHMKLTVLDRDFEEEWSDASWVVYKEVLDKDLVCFSIRSVAPDNRQFVFKNAKTWWCNPYSVGFACISFVLLDKKERDHM
jgi:hypothetical protein